MRWRKLPLVRTNSAAQLREDHLMDIHHGCRQWVRVMGTLSPIDNRADTYRFRR